MKSTYHFFNTVTSTNDLAKEFIRSGLAKNGTVIQAGYQTKGRGRQENFWEGNADENLLFSIILEPKNIHPSNQFIINKLASVTLQKFIKEFLSENSEVKIKWPNDIYVGKEKIAGILIEHLIMGNEIRHSIIGIGLNVNQTVFQHAPNPVSLKTLTGHSFSTEKLCKIFSEQLLDIFQKPPKNITQTYISQLFQLNEICRYIIDGKKITATIKSVSSSGCLCLQLPDGTIKEYELNSLKSILS